MLRKFFLLLGIFFSITTTHAGIAFHDTQGHTFHTANFKGKWIVINFWAPWCSSCASEIPQLNEFYRQKKPNVLFFGFDYDAPSMDILLTQIHQLGIQYPVLVENPERLWQFGNIDVIPMTFIINPQGEIVKKILGTNSAQSLQNTLNDLQNAS